MRSARRTFAAFLAAWCIILGVVTPTSHAQYTYAIYAPTMTGASMGFSIIQPHSTTNLDTNPSFELATTGWTLSSSATIARDTTAAKRGVASLKVTPSSTDNSGAYVTYSLTAQDYTWSADFYGAIGVTYEVHYANSSGTTLATIATVVGTNTWVRIEGTFTESSSATRRIYVKKRGTGTDPFWLDGVQLEALSYATSYCDGDQSGCQWTAGRHVSPSTRSAMYRSGGKKISLASLGAYLISQQGTGMATVENQRIPYALKPGSYFQRSNVRERSLTIALSVAGDGVSDWHARRQTLIDLIKPDLVTPEQPFRLVYDDGGRDVYLDCFYEDGLGIADGIRDIEAIPIKCLATDPFWKVDGNNATTLSLQSTFSGSRIIKRSPLGVWSGLSGTDANNVVDAIAVGTDGKLYLGGTFTSLNSVSSTSHFGYYDPVDGLYHALGSYPGTGSALYDILVGPNNEVYVVDSSIYKWNGSSWSDITTAGAPTPAPAYSVAIGKNGNVYAAGQFTNIGAVAITAVAKYNGSAWSSVSFPGDNAFDITSDAAGNIYVAGSLTGTGHVWKYDGSTWSTVGASPDNAVRALKVGPDGTLYAIGAFTYFGGNPMQYIARSNGSSWVRLGDGLPATPSTVGNTSNALAINSRTGKIAVGTSDNPAVSEQTLYFWNGSSFVPMDVRLPSPGQGVFALAYAPDGVLYVAYNGASTVKTSGVVTATNTGSATAYPIIKVYGPSSGSALLQRIANLTTGKELNLNYTMLPGEILTFTCSPGQTSITSSFRGQINNALQPGSSMSDFGLIAGANSIAAFSDTSTVTGTIQWSETGWSIDSSAP